jgi:hypothetical protein
MSKIIKKLQEENSMCADCMGNFLKSVEAFTGKCQNCNEYYENETNDYCERCGEYFDDFYNVSEEGEDKDEQIRDWIETWHYDNKGLVRPEEMADALNISLYEAQDWIERWQESEEDFRMNESKSEESFQDYFEIKDDDTIVCDLCGMTWHSTQFGAPDGMYHLMSRHDIEASYESLASEWGSWADNDVMTSDDQVKLMQDLGIADKTLKDMGYQNFKRNEEGFMDDIEKLANKVGINLDRDPEQVESKANEESTIDRLRAWQKREDDEWNSLSKEEQDKIHNDYEDEVEAEWNNMSEEERKSYESAGQDFDENDDDDSEDIDNNFQKADPNPEEKITLNEDEMLSKSSESYKALTNNPHIQLNF